MQRPFVAWGPIFFQHIISRKIFCKYSQHNRIDFSFRAQFLLEYKIGSLPHRVTGRLVQKAECALFVNQMINRRCLVLPEYQRIIPYLNILILWMMENWWQWNQPDKKINLPTVKFSSFAINFLMESRCWVASRNTDSIVGLMLLFVCRAVCRFVMKFLFKIYKNFVSWKLLVEINKPIKLTRWVSCKQMWTSSFVACLHTPNARLEPPGTPLMMISII